MKRDAFQTLKPVEAELKRMLYAEFLSSLNEAQVNILGEAADKIHQAKLELDKARRDMHKTYHQSIRLQ